LSITSELKIVFTEQFRDMKCRCSGKGDSKDAEETVEWSSSSEDVSVLAKVDAEFVDPDLKWL